MITVRELIDALADADPDEVVHVCLDLSVPDSVSFHHIREVHPEAGELVVYEAYELFDTTPPDVAAVLLGKRLAELP